MLAGAFGAWQAGKVREKTPPYPLQYGPPDGIGPAQGAYIMTERTEKKDFVASIMEAAAKGSLDLDRSGDSWTVTDTQGPQGWAGLDSVTQRVARLTGGPGLAFTASPGSVSSGEKLKTELAGFESATRSWATSEGFMQRAGLGCLGGLFVIGGGILALLIAGGNFFDMGIVALIPGMLAAGAAPVLASGASTQRTAKGRDLWSRVGGFHRVLSTPSSQNRFDFSGRQDLYTAYIPWAVAFDCADSGRRSTAPRPARSRPSRRTSRATPAPTPATTPTRWSTASPRPSTAPSRPTRRPSPRPPAVAAGAAGSPVAAVAAAGEVVPGDRLLHTVPRSGSDQHPEQGIRP